jgi:IPT/TIG domain
MEPTRWAAGPIALTVGLLIPSAALASVTVGSPLMAAPENPASCGGSTDFDRALGAGTLAVPFDGVIVRWRLDIATGGGSSTYQLRVLRPAGGSSYTGAGTGPAQMAPAAGVNMLALAAPLPVRAGDLIGVNCPNGAPAPFSVTAAPASAYAFFSSTLADGSTASPANTLSGEEELINADVVGVPSVTAVSPASGSTAGGAAVTISGSHLADATGVTFGGTPATAVSAVSDSLLTATAPAHAAGGVDVVVSDAAGQSAVGAGDAFTYQAAPAAPAPPAPLAPAPVPVAPIVAQVRESHAVFRAGNRLARVSRRHATPVGTTFSFALNERASVTFTFTRRQRGRTVTAGTLAFTGHGGTDTVAFQGRVSRSRRLAPGGYTLLIGAANAAGQRSAPQRLRFRILAP